MSLNGQWIELFRAGNYGNKGSYSTWDIDRMVANYDPARHEAPVVMGHPEHDAPAYGWVEALRRSGDVLLGKLKQVPEKFSQLVREGRFKKRSISFLRGENGPSLRHVGFLGAMPPEVKGLADIRLASFSAAQRGTTIEFQEGVHMERISFTEGYGTNIDRKSVDLAERAMQIATVEHVSYGEALMRARREGPEAELSEWSSTPTLPVTGLALCDAAEAVARQRNISFCDALSIARAEIALASDVIEPEQVRQTVETALKGFFDRTLQGTEKIIDRGEVFSAGVAVEEGLKKLKLGPRIADALKADVLALLEGLLNKNAEASITAADAESIVAKAADRAESLYAKELAALRG